MTPLVTSMRWVDASTLIVFLGGMVTRLTAADGTSQQVLEIDPTTNGLLVLDVARRQIVRELRGASATITVPRAGSPTELLFVESAHHADGAKERVGRIDIATGCVHASEWVRGWSMIAIDTVNEGFLMGHQDPNRGAETLERWDAATSRRTASRAVPRFDVLRHDRTTNLAIMTSFGDDAIRVRDPITLADRAERRLDVAVTSGFAIRPGRGEILLPFERRCTPLPGAPRRTMRRMCKEAFLDRGVVVVAIDSLAEVARATLPYDFEPTRASWSRDGAHVVVPCGRGREQCEWTPETGAIRRMPRPSLDEWSVTPAPDNQTYAMPGPDGSVELRSRSTGKLLWQVPLPRRPLPR